MLSLPLFSFWNRRLARPFRSPLKRPGRSVRLSLETLEERTLLATFTPIQIRHAYGFDRIGFEDSTHSLVPGDGQGTTIAIVDPYDDPNIAGDLAKFDGIYGIPDPPSFTKVNQAGGTVLPASNRGWAGEIALDVEYAHAMAPGANILLVEANDASFTNLLVAVSFAASQPGVVAVSMSWGSTEFSTQTLLDNRFLTPNGHNGVTFLAASGDDGAIPSYPPSSPNVVAVGGTALFLDSKGEYLRESGWSGSGGGISRFEPQPAYQDGVVTQSTTRRTTPDLSFVADYIASGVTIYDSFSGRGLYGGIGGTSLACPIMAGLMAIVDQGRSYLTGRSSYSGTDFLKALYHLPQSDLNDIVTGNNGFPAGRGYDLVTGRGAPIVDRFISGLIGAPVYNTLTGTLLVTGGGRGSSDTITLSQSGTQLVVQVSASTPVAGSGNAANQTFTFDSSQYQSVFLATGDGTTTVNLDDSANSADSSITVSATSVTGLSLGSISFGTSSISGLTITAGAGNNSFTVIGTPASQGTTINTGAGIGTVAIQAATSPLTINTSSGSGGDTIFLGDLSNRLSGITASLNVNAAATDALVLNDQGYAGTRNYTITDTTITWGGSSVTYSGLGSVLLNGGKKGNTFSVRATSAATALTIVGGGGDTLVGSDAGNRFAIAGSDAGMLSGLAYGTPILFSQVGNLTAGSGGDTFQFADGAALSGTIQGGGSDTLDYRAYGSNVVVDLQTGLATGVGGLVNGIGTVFGGSGIPTASGVFNLLIGKGGNILTGGVGRRNILVAGSSASTLQAGDGEDLLIAGSTIYDAEAGLSDWLQLAAYWAGSDDYATRMGNLLNGLGVPLLDASVVTANGGSNVLSANGALALIYSDGLDAITGFDPGSQQVPITP